MCGASSSIAGVYIEKVYNIKCGHRQREHSFPYPHMSPFNLCDRVLLVAEFGS